MVDYQIVDYLIVTYLIIFSNVCQNVYMETIPEVLITGHVDTKVSFIPNIIDYVLREVLKNSFRYLFFLQLLFIGDLSRRYSTDLVLKSFCSHIIPSCYSAVHNTGRHND